MFLEEKLKFHWLTYYFQVDSQLAIKKALHKLHLWSVKIIYFKPTSAVCFLSTILHQRDNILFFFIQKCTKTNPIQPKLKYVLL